MDIDTEEASQQPGVLGVFTSADLGLPRIAHTLPMLPDGMRRPLLATDVVRFAGEPIVAVVAEDQYLAADAAELVVVDYDPLPPLVDPGGRGRPTRSCCSRRSGRTPPSASSRSSGPTSASARSSSRCGWRTSA